MCLVMCHVFFYSLSSVLTNHRLRCGHATLAGAPAFSHAFQCILWLHLFSVRYDWFILLSACVVIGRINSLVL